MVPVVDLIAGFLGVAFLKPITCADILGAVVNTHREGMVTRCALPLFLAVCERSVHVCMVGVGLAFVTGSSLALMKLDTDLMVA